MAQRSLAGVGGVVAAAVLALGAGVGIGYAVFHPQVSRAEGGLSASRAQVAQLQEEVTAKTGRIEDLLAGVADLREDLALSNLDLQSARADLTSQRDATEEAREDEAATRAALDASNVEVAALEEEEARLARLDERLDALREQLGQMEDDRLLLVELRKEMPSQETQAVAYWERVKALAVRSDPSLGPKVDRVLREIPSYFRWVEGSYSTTCESVDAFFDTGASELGVLQGDLQKDVSLVVINRIDAALAAALD